MNATLARRLPRPVPTAALRREVATACLFLSVALGGCERGPDQPTTIPAPTADPETASGSKTASPLAFEPPELQFGELMPETPVTKTVVIRNLSGKAVTISEAISECGCTQPARPDGTIEPGGTREAEITMDPGRRQGLTLRKRVTYLLDDGQKADFMVEGRVGLYLTYAPETLEVPADLAMQGEIRIESADGTEFSLLGSDPEGIVTPSASAGKSQVARVDWNRWRAAGSPIKIDLYTDHPVAPPLGVVVRRPTSP